MPFEGSKKGRPKPKGDIVRGAAAISEELMLKVTGRQRRTAANLRAHP